VTNWSRFSGHSRVKLWVDIYSTPESRLNAGDRTSDVYHEITSWTTSENIILLKDELN